MQSQRFLQLLGIVLALSVATCPGHTSVLRDERCWCWHVLVTGETGVLQQASVGLLFGDPSLCTEIYLGHPCACPELSGVRANSYRSDYTSVCASRWGWQVCLGINRGSSSFLPEGAGYVSKGRGYMDPGKGCGLTSRCGHFSSLALYPSSAEDTSQQCARAW